MRHLLPRAVLGFGFLLLALLANPVSLVVHSAEWVVVNPADSGDGTLRWALLSAAAGDTITFSPSTFPPATPVTIWVRAALPTLNRDSVLLDASNAGVILNGSQAPAGTNGLIVEADNCTIRGLTIQGFASNGIFVAASASGTTIGGDRTVGSGSNGQGNLIALNGGSGLEIRGDGNLVRGNYVGVDGSGTWDWGNVFNGIALWQGASGNTIGGTSSGQRNVVGGNDQNGIWIGGSSSDSNVVIGNYVGARADGLGPVPNSLSGIAIQNGAQNNRIGGPAGGEGNLISGNTDNGLYIADPGTTGNRVLGNIIGPNRLGTGTIGQGGNGIVLTQGAQGTIVGTSAAPNLISGNTFDGVRIEGSDTTQNTVQGNIIGANLSGTAALPNGMHGVELTGGTHDNQIGGNRLAGQGNLLSGNLNHGLLISDDAHDNTVQGNLVGPDATGSYSLGNQPWGGIDVSNGASGNVIGGSGTGEGNVVSGNDTDGIAIFISSGDVPAGNQLVGNLIGVALDGSPLPNGGFGILITDGVEGTQILSNTIAYNDSYGVLVATCGGNTISGNSIYSNALTGIRNEGTCPAAPRITGVALGATETVAGTAQPNTLVEIFSDDEDEGKIFEGSAQADGSGNFAFSQVGGFAGPNITATSTRTDTGDTSEFSLPTHLLWTVMLYLSADNDLDEFMVDTLTNTVAAGPSPRANVLALVDGYTTTAAYSPTVVYDLTHGEAVPLDVTWNLTGELDMGSGQTLVDFVTWGRDYYPARHTMLAIVDHGGGWAPSNEGIPGAMPIKGKWAWLAGNSGLSWDFSSNSDYLGSQEIRQAMATITGDGAQPLDVVFYDVCLMGMTEVAYQIKDYAAFFVSSQNVAWAPLGPQGRYVETIQGLDAATTTPRQMAEFVVEAYANSLPAEEHPFTISAVDLAAMPAVASAAHQLAEAISQTLAIPSQAVNLRTAYNLTQKLDYDSDFQIEPSSDGFVDLYDLALKASQQFTDEDVVAAAQNLMTVLDSAIVAEEHRSGNPWVYPERTWDLHNVHGLSIFLPLGEDRIITTTFPISATQNITRGIRLREMYNCDQLQFVCDTAWRGMIDTYYVVAPLLPDAKSTGPLGGLLPTDFTPPQTMVSVDGTVSLGQTVSLTWVAHDSQAGVYGGALWYRPPHGPWTSLITQTGSSGVFPIVLSQTCSNAYTVRGIDKAGNVEPLFGGSNWIILDVPPCERLYLPLVVRRHE